MVPRINIIVADVQYRNGSVIISVWLMPRMKVSALDNAKYMVKSASRINWAGYSVSTSSGDDYYLSGMAGQASISPGYVFAYGIAFCNDNLGEWASLVYPRLVTRLMQ